MLFHQVVPLLFTNPGDIQPANLHTALVKTFVDAAGAVLVVGGTPSRTARVCQMLVELLHVCYAHSRVLVSRDRVLASSGAYTPPPKLQHTVRSFVRRHLHAIAPWPPRVTSMLNLLLTDVADRAFPSSTHQDGDADDLLVACLAVSAPHLQPPPAPVYTHLHAALCHSPSSSTASSLARLHTQVSLDHPAAIDMTLSVLRHWLAWTHQHTPPPRAQDVLAHLHNTTNTLVLLERICHMYLAVPTPPIAIVPAAFLTVLLQLTHQLLSHDTQRVGHWLLEYYAAAHSTHPRDHSSPPAVWFLLVLTQCSPALLDECVRVHGTMWLEQTCRAFLAVIRLPPEHTPPIPSIALARFPSVLDEVLASARRHSVAFSTAHYLMHLGPVVSHHLQVNLQSLRILDDDDDTHEDVRSQSPPPYEPLVFNNQLHGWE
ncbi:hypothetical protein DYB25_005465 [Aphanomyces astaci]|uniref:Uncharacterized protein n=2 Tax=Aphanomyces astaci TaxID=112090 RepID=A0A397BMZ4_APHAT|nr:hypothetical protein DYB25_005465 [Aphanomyces astaci]